MNRLHDEPPRWASALGGSVLRRNRHERDTVVERQGDPGVDELWCEERLEPDGHAQGRDEQGASVPFSFAHHRVTVSAPNHDSSTGIPLTAASVIPAGGMQPLD